MVILISTFCILTAAVFAKRASLIISLETFTPNATSVALNVLQIRRIAFYYIALSVLQRVLRSGGFSKVVCLISDVYIVGQTKSDFVAQCSTCFLWYRAFIHQKFK